MAKEDKGISCARDDWGRANGGPGSALVNRRRVLSLAGSTTSVVFLAQAVPGCGEATGSPPTGPVAAGNVSALSLGKMLVVSNVVVARDSGGIYAMSAVCTHAGCLIQDASATVAAGLFCSCHNSAFDGNGTPTQGPARAPLQHYAVSIAADGSLTVEGGQPVDMNTRTPAN